MTEADDNVVDLRDLDQLFEEVLAGQVPAPDAPAWCGDLARLVQGARVEAAPGELAAQDAIVTRMLDVRRAMAAVDGAGGVEDDGALAPPPVAPVAAPYGTDAGAGHDVAVPSVPSVPSVRRLDGGRSPRHAERGYRAKHAAARTQASTNPTVRNVGRLIAAKAAAVTTAVVVGTVAAAATTGIVANVVVPALTSTVPDAPPATKTTLRPDGGGAGGGSGDEDVTVQVPACQLTPVCSPLTPAGPTPDPGPALPTDPSVPTTERPSSSTTTTEPPATTTTTEAPPTTGPDPTTTTTTETPPPTEPDPVSTMSSPDAVTPASP